jgi:hypothetical protein
MTTKVHQGLKPQIPKNTTYSAGILRQIYSHLHHVQEHCPLFKNLKKVMVKVGGIGNSCLLELEGQRARVYTGIPFDSGDYGEPNEMSIVELKDLIRSWQAHLLKKQK